jgi:hypothetical protein
VPGSDPGARLILGLQGSAGNQAVTRALASGSEGRRTLARLRRARQWIRESELLMIDVGPLKANYPRSDELEVIDRRLRDYDRVRDDDDLDARKQALLEIETAIGAWRRSKEPDISNPDRETREAAQQHGAANVKRWRHVADLDDEVREEKDLVQQQLNERDAEREKARRGKRARDEIDPLIPEKVRGLADVGEKARELFGIFMHRFGGKAIYTTTTQRDVSIWDGGGTVACATICYGLVELLERAGVSAEVVKITPVNFLTTRLRDTFIDPASEGNVRRPGESFAATRRFFFTQHFVVAIKGGPVLDPTSGVATDLDGTGVVDDDVRDLGPMPGGVQGYQNDKHSVRRVGSGPSGGQYELSAR